MIYTNFEYKKDTCSFVQECVADIEAALRSDYPSSSGYKLMLRKAHCLHHLGNKEGLNKCE